MNLEQQVTNLALSKRLAELGVQQESLFVHYCHEDNDGHPYWRIDTKKEWEYDVDKKREPISAFTVAELSNMLPDNYRILKQLNEWIVVNAHCLRCDGHDSFWFDELQVNAIAKCLIELIEQGLMKVKE